MPTAPRLSATAAKAASSTTVNRVRAAELATSVCTRRGEVTGTERSRRATALRMRGASALTGAVVRITSDICVGNHKPATCVVGRYTPTSPALLRLSRFTVPTTPTTVIHGFIHTGRNRWPIGSALGQKRRAV